MTESNNYKSLVLHDVIQHIPALRGYAWTLTRKSEDVDDLVQETLTKAIANAERFRHGTNLRAWLMTIMRNTFYNEIIKRNRERPGSEDCVSALAVAPSTQEWWIQGSEILNAIKRLPTHYRETLVLVLMLGESYERTAEICEVPVGTIKSRIYRARAMVLEDLGVAELSEF